MLLVALIAQASLLVRPTFLDPDPPQVRSARHILLKYDGVSNSKAERTKEATIALANDLATRLRAGADFSRSVEQFSQGPTARTGGVMGSYPPGVLAPEIDAFLQSAQIDEVSGPLESETGVHIVQRIESHAAVRRMLFAGENAAARCDSVLAALRAGGDFAKLALEHSNDAESAARGGAFAIYERGYADKLLKAAAFEARMGEVVGPIDTPPLGSNLIQRVPLDSIDRSLAESNFARFSAILVRFEGSAGGAQYAGMPSSNKARAIVDGLRARVLAGEEFDELARERSDDPASRERGGDLGWVHRYTPDLLEPIQKSFLVPVGALSEVMFSNLGFVLLKRTR